MNKEIISGKEAQELIKDTVIKLCDYVGMTLGPKGYNAIIDTDYTEPFITNDGVTIAKNLEFEPREEAIAKIIKEASIKTCDKVGDGTTSSLVLLKSMYTESLKYIDKGISPLIIKENLSKSVDKVCDSILLSSRKPLLKDIENIATISSGNNSYGKIISSIFKKNKSYVKIIIEESNNEKSHIEFIDGYFIENGVVSSYMINNRLESELIKNPYFLITDYKIETVEQIISILNALKGKSLVIIAESFDEEVIEFLSSLKSNNEINVIGIEAPNYSENKIDILEDICIYTNAKLISSKKGKILESVSVNDLGTSINIKVSRNNSVIKNKINENIKTRIRYIKRLISKEESDFKKDILESRLSYLSSTTSVIYVGAKTKSEMILNKMRIEDAVYACKTAIKYGYSLGGGKELYNVSKCLNENDMGDAILKLVLISPIKQIISNSGENTDKIINELSDKKLNIGYDAYNNKIVDLIESGIIDPTYVLIESLKNAFSISSILLTTSLIIVTKDKKEDKNITEVL